MSKLLFIIILVLLAVTSPEHAANAVAEGPEAVEQWFKNLRHSKVKLTKIQFYFHDIVSGKNPTAVEIAHSSFKPPLPNFFGLVRMMDNALTEGPQPNLKVIGQAKGIYGVASKEDFGLLMTLNCVFTEGEHKGNTLSILGHNAVFEMYRELPVVGGSGPKFRLAHGVATAQTVKYDNTTFDALVKYTVFVLHY